MDNLKLYKYVQAVFMLILIKLGLTSNEARETLERIRRAELHE